MVFMRKSLWTMCALVALSYQPVQAMEESEEQGDNFTRLKRNSSLQSPMKVKQEDFFSEYLRDINTLVLKEVFYEKDEKEGFGKTYWNLSLVTKESYYLVKEYGPKWILEACGIKKITPQAKDVFGRLFKGKLIYNPDPSSTKGQVTLSISSLPNPLGGEFDLSNCGDTGQYLSINMGYRKVKTPANADKLEIWVTPRFFVDERLPQLAENHHIRKIEGNWDAGKDPIGIFWTMGGWNVTHHIVYCDYLTVSMNDLGSKNLFEKYQKAGRMHLPIPAGCGYLENFTFCL